MKLRLEGRVALVTGAARDVGREIALALSSEGAAVTVNYNSSSERAQAVVEEIKAQGGRAIACKADIADLGAVKRMVDRTATELGSLDILVNNAGLVIRKRFAETSPDEWRRQIDTCLYGAIHCCYAATPLLEASKQRPHHQPDGRQLPHRRVRSVDRRCRPRRRHRPHEIAGSRAGAIGNNGQRRLARLGGDALTIATGSKRTGRSSSGSTPCAGWGNPRTSRRWWHFLPQITAAGLPAR